MVDYFLKIDSVPGESHDAHHPDEIPVTAFAWGESGGATPLGSGGGAGKVQMEAFHFAAVTSKASPKLMLLCANGKHVKSAVLVARRAGPANLEYLKITFTDVTVSSYEVAGSSNDVPVDEVSLSFAKVAIDYKPQNANGSLGAVVHAGWDRLQNKEF
jgi:type VI secretion system secreted protein Hcp